MATVPSYTPSSFQVSLRDRREVAEATMAFFFDRPPDFAFKAGQALDLTLLNPPETDSEGNIRTFSIASPPYEPAHLMITTRMRNSAFKRVLREMPLGTQVNIQGPSGSFTLHHNATKPAVFLMGGIGITPVMSIVRQATHDRSPHQLYLLYSNRRPEDAPFLDVLERLAAENSNFHFVPTMTHPDKSQRRWDGATGYITDEMLRTHVKELQGPIYYVAGPPAMVAAMRQVLEGAGVDEDDIRTEEFSGY